MQAKTIFHNSMLILMVGLLFSCSSGSRSEAEGEEEEEEEVSTEFVTLTERQMEVVELQFARLEKRKLSLTIPVSGKLALWPHDNADVSTTIGGIITNIRVIEGDVVQKGSILATLQHPDIIQLQQTYVSGLNKLNYLQKEYERQKRLSEESVGSEKVFEQTKAQYNMAKTDVKAAKMKLSILGIEADKVENGTFFSSVNIISPIAGKVSTVEINTGSSVVPDQKLFEIVNSNNVHADVTVFQKDINKVRIGQQIHFYVQGFNEAIKGSVRSISPQVESTRNGIHVHCIINPSNATLIPEMYLRGKIIVEEIDVLALPQESVVNDNGSSYIFVRSENQLGEEEEEEQNENNAEEIEESLKWTFRKTEVVVGASTNEYVEIRPITDIPKTAEVVAYGAYYLLAEMGKGEVEDDD